MQPLILLILEKPGPLPEQGQPPRPGKVALTYAALSIVLWLEWRLHATCRSVGRGAELVVWLRAASVKSIPAKEAIVIYIANRRVG